MNDNWYTQWRIMQDHIAERHRDAVKQRLMVAARAERLLRVQRHGQPVSKPA